MTAKRYVSYSRRMARRSTLSPLYWVFAASQQAKQLLDDALDGAPLDAADYALYSAILDLEPVTPTALSRQLGMPVSTTLDAVRTLERRGHIERSRNPRDGRSYLLALNAAGRAAHDGTHDFFAVVDERLSAHLGDRRDDIIAALQELVQAGHAAQESVEAERMDLAG